MKDINKILEQEYNFEFDELRKNRVATSFFKYGPAKTNFSNKLIDATASANLCLDKYRATGNTEYLCDAANYMMFEFSYPQHPKAHFRSTDSGESAGIVGMGVKQMEEKYGTGGK